MKYLIIISLLVVFIINPLGLEGFWPLVYIVPLVLYLALQENMIFNRSNQTQYEIEQKIDKWVKLAIQFLGVLAIATSVGSFEIPFLYEIINIFKYIGDNVGAGSEAVGVLIGIFITLYGMIKDSFGVTKQLSRRFIKDQYKKYEG
jgi:hypothetical protein